MNYKVDNIKDHQLIRFEAIREGLTYRDYRRKLRLHEIPLETAIENVKEGVSIKDYLEQTSIFRKRSNIIMKSMITASFIGLIGSLYFNGPSNYETALKDYQDAVRDYPNNVGDLELKLKELKSIELNTLGISN